MKVRIALGIGVLMVIPALIALLAVSRLTSDDPSSPTVGVSAGLSVPAAPAADQQSQPVPAAPAADQQSQPVPAAPAADQQSPSTSLIPRPPSYPPIHGDQVSLEEARRRTSYTIPIPPSGVVGADLKEIWVSVEGRPAEFRQVYLMYSNGLRISIGGRPDAIDHSTLADDPFRATNVRGIPARGKDPAVKTLSAGGQVNTPASLGWWVNRVDIALYHPTWSMEQLLEIGEAMPDPTWPSN